MLRTVARTIAWLLLAGLVFVTLAPIGLRPESGGPVWAERFGAYFLTAAAFGMGYPGRWRRIALLLVLCAVTLEAAQALSPTRHGRPLDALEKALGAAVGSLLIAALERRALMRRTSEAPSGNDSRAGVFLRGPTPRRK